jgi:hypothetical protein
VVWPETARSIVVVMVFPVAYAVYLGLHGLRYLVGQMRGVGVVCRVFDSTPKLLFPRVIGKLALANCTCVVAQRHSAPKRPEWHAGSRPRVLVSLGGGGRGDAKVTKQG